MLKGHVFSKQLFENPIFAVFINTFLNGTNGVSNNYKNGMKPTASGSTVNVDSGVVCIQGRFIEEDTSTPISAGTDNMYCKLVIEINLDLENTESQFNQASYKIVKSATGYPELTQSNIVKNLSGIYQYELARFRTTASGITDFQDKRTYLDFSSIYTKINTDFEEVLEQLEQELENVENGSAYLLNKVTTYKFNQGRVSGSITKQGRVAALEFKITSGSMSETIQTINLPEEFKALGEITQNFVQFAGSEAQTVQAHANVFISSSEVDFSFSNSADGLKGTLTYITSN